MTMTSLSRKDKLVLGALFDSESSIANVASIEDNASQMLPGISALTLKELQERELSAVRLLNHANPPRSDIEEAVCLLSAIIQEAPGYPSAWNNRAQAVRMLVGDDITEPTAAASTLYSDLSEACRRAAPTPAHPTVSSLQARILASAHTHRAHLLLRSSKALKHAPEKACQLPVGLRDMDGEKLERLAGLDFQLGGKYGNHIAKQMAVHLNPYAKMCGEIVKEAMQRDMRDSMKPSILSNTA